MHRFNLILISAMALLLAGCPNASDGDETALEQQTERTGREAGEELAQAGNAAEQLGENTQNELQQFGQEAQQEAGQLAEESQEFADRAGEGIRDGYANISADVQERYPEMVDAVQRQFYAMNAWAVDEYRETFAENAPRRQQLTDDFKQQVNYKPRYTIESFEVVSATATSATARVVLALRSTDKAAPPGERRETYVYSFRQEADGDDWVVYDVQPAEKQAEQK